MVKNMANEGEEGEEVDARYRYPPRYYGIESARGMEENDE